MRYLPGTLTLILDEESHTFEVEVHPTANRFRLIDKANDAAPVADLLSRGARASLVHIPSAEEAGEFAEGVRQGIDSTGGIAAAIRRKEEDGPQ